MLKRGSTITKTGDLIEPPNPRSSKNFFKSANDWFKLSAYISTTSSRHSKEHLEQPYSYFPLSPTSRTELSLEDHESKVGSALSYLFLRDIGCTRESAISLTSCKRSSPRDIITNLPPGLQNAFRLKLSKNHCLPCRPLENHEEYDSVADQFKKLIFKNQAEADPFFSKQEKYLKQVEKEVKKLKVFNVLASSSYVFVDKEKKMASRTATKTERNNKLIVPNLDFNSEASDLSGYMRSDANSGDPSTRNMEIWKSAENLKLRDVNHGNSSASPHMVSFQSLSPKNSEWNRSKKIETNFSSLFQTIKREKEKLLNKNSHHTIFNQDPEKSPSKNPPIPNSTDLNLPEQKSPPSRSSTKDLSFHKMQVTEKKLLDLITLKKLQNAKIKREEKKKLMKDHKTRKIQQDLKLSSEKHKKLLQTHEKLFKARSHLITPLKSTSPILSTQFQTPSTPTSNYLKRQ